jgi:chromosome segregation ATPase
MAEDDELERRVRKLTVEHAETRWLALRLDDDVKDIREVLREHTTRFDSIDRKLHDHDARFDSIDQALHDHSAQFDSIFRTLHEFNARFDSTDLELQEVRGRFASVDAVLRSLHQMVGQVLERLPEESPG